MYCNGDFDYYMDFGIIVGLSPFARFAELLPVGESKCLTPIK